MGKLFIDIYEISNNYFIKNNCDKFYEKNNYDDKFYEKNNYDNKFYEIISNVFSFFQKIMKSTHC